MATMLTINVNKKATVLFWRLTVNAFMMQWLLVKHFLGRAVPLFY